MDVESRKSLKNGFVLKETDLRRLVDLATQQLTKLPDTHIGNARFRMKFRNGVLADTESLEEVFQQENTGSGQIIRLNYEQATNEQIPSRIALEFINADEDDEPGLTSMRFHVFGHSRDWIFVSSSLLEERLEKIKRFCPNQLGSRGPFSIMTVLFGLILFFLIFGGFAYNSTKHLQPSGKLEDAVKSGQITTPLQGMIFLEKVRENAAKQDVFDLLGKPVVLIFSGMALLGLIWWFFYKYYPVYNFCWGDYTTEFNHKEGVRRFWFVVVAIGLVLSFIGSLLANKIHL